MARKIIHQGQVDSGGFADRLPTLSRDLVHANSPSRLLPRGRGGEALEALRQQAFELGRDEGYQAGLIAGRADGVAAVEDETRGMLLEFAQLLQTNADRVVEATGRWLQESEQQLAELALAVAAKIIAQEVSAGIDVATPIARQAIEEIRHAEHVRIRLNPFDAPLVAAKRDELLAACRQLRVIEIVEDPTIDGGCVIESDAGMVDATLATKFASVLQSLREAA